MEREQVRDNARRFRDLPADEQERLRGAWDRLSGLPPEERERVVDELLSEAGY